MALPVSLQMTGLGGGPLRGIHDGRGERDGRRIPEVSGSHHAGVKPLVADYARLPRGFCCENSPGLSGALGTQANADTYSSHHRAQTVFLHCEGVLVPLAAGLLQGSLY